MADEDVFSNPPTTATSPIKSGFDATSEMASEPQGQPAAPFNAGKGAGTQASGQPSPMDINASAAANPFSPQNVSAESMQQQAATIYQQFQKAQGQLQDPALTQHSNLLTAATTNLLSQHLSRVNDNLSSLSEKTGTPLQSAYTPPGPGTQAIAHFLDYLTGSQQDLAAVTNKLQNSTGKMNPGELMAVQLKMSGVQQQMEFFSVLLGSAISNIKTIMSIQT